MREIKFRAWDINGKGFINGFNMFGFSTGQGAPTRFLRRFDRKWKMEDVVIQQCTNLEDKNGKKIYDGDIVEVSTLGINYMRDYINGVVELIDGCFTVVFSQPVYDVTLKTQRKSLYVKCFTINHDIKVIGHINKNPELLEVTKK